MNTIPALERLKRVLMKHRSLCVAYSGGVDSTLLLSVAAETHPGRVIPVIGTGAFVPEHEAEEAIAFCRSLDLEPVVLTVGFLDNPVVAANPADRCYHCKHMIFSEILRTAAHRSCEAVVEGTNLDDLKDYRPGLAALKELQIVSPFVEAGLTKAEIRQLSRARGLETWNKPAMSCLASRIPTGDPLQAAVLKTVEAGESCLKQAGFSQYRLRVHGDIARIEVPTAELQRALEKRMELTQALKNLGFRHITLDLEGYHTGSNNRIDG